MYRLYRRSIYTPPPPPLPPLPPHSWWLQQSLSRLLVPLTLWICVSVSLRYRYYGDRSIVVGPSSSLLMKASSLFVKQIEMRDGDKKGAFLYGFWEKPELSCETNWSVSNYLIVASYSHKDFSLWLNKDSRISMRWEAQTSNLHQLQVFMLKGEGKYETLLPKLTSSPDSPVLNEPIKDKNAEYTIEEDDRYYIQVLNANPRSIIMTLNLNVSSKMYDISKAKNMCSTLSGTCQLELLFPNTQYVILTTPNNGDLGGWYIELSFVSRIITYIAILGFIVVVIFLILKYLGACDSENTVTETDTPTPVWEINETRPIMLEKEIQSTYGTNEEDEESGGSSSSSEELYDAKLCIICYDEQRNCFFVPCGHCATCYDCAQRIMEGENKVCPICRRPIHKVRRLFKS